MDDDGDCVECCAVCCTVSCCWPCCCCLGAVDFICSCCGLIVAAVLIGVLVPAYGVVLDVRATVKDASLGRLALGGANGTALEYDLALTVALRNRNWAMRADLSAPLDAELRFAGRRIDGARLAEVGRGISMDPHGTEEFRMLVVSSQGVELGGAGAAEFARQRVAGVFELELKLAGAFRYRPVHVGGSKKLDVTCPVKLQMAAAPTGTHSLVFDKIITCY
ncbi:hypothetical protein ACP70R_036570 [Stipagrostis hirtigluma subsp. patula]